MMVQIYQKREGPWLSQGTRDDDGMYAKPNPTTKIRVCIFVLRCDPYSLRTKRYK